MKTMVIPYPESVPAALGMSTKDFESESRMALAVKLFELGRMTSGQAADIAGVDRVSFLLGCRRFGAASVEWDADEFASEAKER